MISQNDIFKLLYRIKCMDFNFFKTEFMGDSNIGLYGFATNDYCFLGRTPRKRILNNMKKALGVDVLTSTISGSDLVGLFSAGNNNGVLVTSIVYDYELKKIKEMFDINVEVLKSKETALGNLILCNDKGCIISKSLKRFKGQIEDILNCDVEIGKVSKLEIVGSAALANNSGCLCHREASEKEMENIEHILGVKADVGTVSYGSPFVKSGLIVNDNGVVFSNSSTGAEIGRVEEVFK